MDHDGLDELALAMTHWLEAAERHAGDPVAGRRALDEARRWLLAATRTRFGRGNPQPPTTEDTAKPSALLQFKPRCTGGACGCTAPPPVG